MLKLDVFSWYYLAVAQDIRRDATLASVSEYPNKIHQTA